MKMKAKRINVAICICLIWNLGFWIKVKFHSNLLLIIMLNLKVGVMNGNFIEFLCNLA